MARARMTDLGGDLSNLLGAVPEPSPQADSTPGVEKARPSSPEKPQPAEAKPSPDPAAKKAAASAPLQESAGLGIEAVTDGPRYLTFMRKEARIAQAHADQLSSIARSLNMARKGTGERITDNTLIRVAIALLLERRDELSGTTEAELFHSLGLDPAN